MKIKYVQHGLYDIYRHGDRVATVYGKTGQDALDWAMRFAAVADLLPAMKALVAAVPELCECERHEIESNALDDAEAAIAKAEGGAALTSVTAKAKQRQGLREFARERGMDLSNVADQSGIVDVTTGKRASME